MNIDRIKEIQAETAYPQSISVQQALLKVWNECEQQHPTPTLADSMIEDIFYLNFAKFFCTVDDEKHCIEAMEYIRDFMQSGEANSEFELQRLYDWLMDEKRKPANTAFTSGITRNVAREIEFRLSQSGESPQESKGDGIDLRKELYNFKSFIESRHPNGIVYLSKKVIEDYLSARQGKGDGEQCAHESSKISDDGKYWVCADCNERQSD